MRQGFAIGLVMVFLLGSLFLSGCATSLTRDDMTTDSGEDARSNTTMIYVKTLFSPGMIIGTNQNEVYEITYDVKGAKKTFRVLFGPMPGTSMMANAKTPIGGQPFYVIDGFAYAEGDEPTTTSSRVSATGHGTIILLEVPESGSHRVYLLKGSQLDVENAAGVKKNTQTTYTYFEVGSNGDLGAPKPVVSGSSEEEFIEKVLVLAQDAGLAVP